jgi:3-deoxy-manno-octulosonate cytidylyltransferase (CMP-KDO synthetase)
LQGDQPFLDPAMIDALAAACIARQPTPAVLTPIYRLSAEQLHNPNVVKVVLAADGRGLYFSRSALPHGRDVDPADWAAHANVWGHVGLYAYRAAAAGAGHRRQPEALSPLDPPQGMGGGPVDAA